MHCMMDADISTTDGESSRPAANAAGFDVSSRDHAHVRVRISGRGLATPLGTTAEETWDNMLAGGYLLDHATVPLDRSADGTRVGQLALRVLLEAIMSAGWGEGEIQSDQTALLVGTSKGPIEAWLANSSTMAGPHGFGLATLAGELTNALRFGGGPKMTQSAACASGLLALVRAAMMIESGKVRRAVVVAVESSLHPLFLGSFQRLGVLAKPGEGCRPFDRRRDGFLMSEAAAAICLEGVELQPRPRPGIYIDRYAVGGAGGHLTAGDPTGALWRHLLHRVIAGRPFDLIHAHATGTLVNDPIELAAIEHVLKDPATAGRPNVYSHKGALGHSLGSAGVVAIVLNCLMHESHTVLPNLRTTDPLAMTNVTLSPHVVARTIHRSLAAASGFGGPTAVVSIEKF